MSVRLQPNRAIAKCCFTGHLRTHQALQEISHLLPEHLIVHDKFPIIGLQPAPALGDAFVRPVVTDVVSFFVDELAVELEPSVATFEAHLVARIQAAMLEERDIQTTVQPMDMPSARIVERRIRVRVAYPASLAMGKRGSMPLR